MKKLFLLLCALLLVPVLAYGWLYLSHNQTIEAPSAQRQAQSLERSIEWLHHHRQAVLNENNAMLWWMIKRSADISGDPRLKAIYQQYYRRYVSGNYQNIWRGLFVPGDEVVVPAESVRHLPDYNQYFLYGLTCGDSLAKAPVIQAQFSTGFCADVHPVSPACVTHQLMGLRFRQDRGCGAADDMARDVAILQDVIVGQLTWDVRQVDVYLQRLLMLAETGASERIEPVWLQQMIDAQLQDGSWGDFHPLLVVGGGKSLGMGSRFFKVRKPSGNLHATAQGIFLLTLLTHST